MAVEANLPPAPPPPPPPLSPLAVINNFRTTIFKHCSTTNEEDLNWALDKLLTLKKNLVKIFYISNTDVKAQLQDGPKCGLVALSIATTIKNVPISADYIYDKALSLGYTKQGEIFSAEFLENLALNYCGFSTKIINGGLYFHFHCIINHLINKNLILVPYDSDHNHHPCCKKGFKAHWAVICGILVLAEKQETENDVHFDTVTLESNGFPSEFCNCLNNDSNRNELNIYFHKGKVILSKKMINNFENLKDNVKGEIYLIGRQGKSKHIGLWPFHEMFLSNNNLMFFSSEKNKNDYVLPKGELAEGLKGKAIILKI